jgi:hypothetical protein
LQVAHHFHLALVAENIVVFVVHIVACIQQSGDSSDNRRSEKP